MVRNQSFEAIINLKLRNAQDRYASMLENWGACLPNQLTKDKAQQIQALIDSLTEHVSKIQNVIIDLAFSNDDDITSQS